MHETRSNHVDYDLHGLTSIRLLDASQQDIAGVTSQLGPIQRPVTTEPDIIIKYVDQLPITSSLRYVGTGDVGFTEEALIMQSPGGRRAQIPFEQIGGRCQITSERNIGKIPLLIPILNLTMLSKGVIPLHATAFIYNGTGVLVTGWAKGGKTETLLGFMARGAIYVGDEWVYISKDGLHMYGIPEPIRVWDAHLQEAPEFRHRINYSDRARLRALSSMIQLTERAIKLAGGSASASRLVRLLKRQQYVQLLPHQLFIPPVGPFVGTPDKVFFVVNHEAPEVKIEPINAKEVARRMVFSLEFERLGFMSHYLEFRFAFPDARNEFIEQAEELQRDLLGRALAGKPAYAVYHPYPAPIPALCEAISSFLTRKSDSDFYPVKTNPACVSKSSMEGTALT